MNNFEIQLGENIDSRAETAKKAVDEAFRSLSLLADSLIDAAKEETETRGEYIAFMRGAAFIFYKVCKRDDADFGKNATRIESVQDAIIHCWELFPFMTKEEAFEHIQLVEWLNELLVLRGEEPVLPPKEYMKDEYLRDMLHGYQRIYSTLRLNPDGSVKTFKDADKLIEAIKDEIKAKYKHHGKEF